MPLSNFRGKWVNWLTFSACKLYHAPNTVTRRAMIWLLISKPAAPILQEINKRIIARPVIRNDINESENQCFSMTFDLWPSFAGFFIQGFPRLLRFQAHHDRILKKYLPKLKKHLDKNGIDTGIYTLKWFFQCFLDRVSRMRQIVKFLPAAIKTQV